MVMDEALTAPAQELVCGVVLEFGPSVTNPIPVWVQFEDLSGVRIVRLDREEPAGSVVTIATALAGARQLGDAVTEIVLPPTGLDGLPGQARPTESQARNEPH